MTPNPGHLPSEAAGRRVNVRCRNGRVQRGWQADGRGGCRWTLTGDDWDIVAFEVAK